MCGADVKNRKIDGSIPDALRASVLELCSDLKAARRVRRMSQADLASRVGVGRNTIVRLEAGDHRVSIGVLMASAWVLGLEGNLARALNPEADPEFIRKSRLSLPERVRPEGIAASNSDLDF